MAKHLRKFEDLRARLQRERATAIDGLQRLRLSLDPDEMASPAGTVIEEGDAAQANERRDMAVAQRERLAARVESLSAALDRIEQGTYGVCEVCGDPIEAERLLALPDARTCIRCQEQLERSNAA